MKVFADGDICDFITVGGNLIYPTYIIKGGQKNLMVDAGINLLGPLYLESIEKSLGDRNNLHMCAVTHSHYDHLGSIPYLKRQIPGLETGGFGRINRLLKKESVVAEMRRLYEVQRELFRDITGDADVRFDPFELDVELKQGDEIDLGGRTVQVHEAPGHTRDSLAFFVPDLGALFAGEAVGVPGLKGVEDLEVEFLSSYDDYVESLEKIIALAPRIIGFAHGWVFTDEDATEYLEASLAATPRHRDRIETYLDRVHGDVAKAIELWVKERYDDRGGTGQERNAYVANRAAQINLVARMKSPVT